MKSISFSELAKFNNTALDIQYAIDYCKEHNISRLVFEKGIYSIDPLFCLEKNLCISNHGYNGPKRIAMLIDGIKDFEIDFGGSTLILNGIIIPIAIINSSKIRITNVKIENKAVHIMQTEVLAYGDGFVDVKIQSGKDVFKIIDGRLYAPCPGRMLAPIDLNVEFRSDTGEIEYGTADNTLGAHVTELNYELMGEDIMRISGVERMPPIGNILVFSGGRRLASGIFCENSSDLNLENIDIHSCFGMGIIAQMCNNIYLNSFNALRKNGNYFTTFADATHFVNCSGTICVENSTFEGMLDDALNIHGIYTRIIDKGKDWIIVKEMHPEATGIRIYRPGDRITILTPESLLPYTEKTVSRAQYINDECIRLVLKETAEDILVGDDVENLTLNADLIFRNNTVRDNRARGMLIATKGKVLIENNYFHTSGSAIKFESDGEFWFESGSTDDVTIKNNKFDCCKYGGWGNATIECQARNAVEETKFHKSIKIIDNVFKLDNCYAALMDNIDILTLSGNEFNSTAGDYPEIRIVNVNKLING